MKRMLMSVAGVAALALGVPGVAAAHGKGHHHKHHSKHHAKLRFETLNPDGTTTSSTTPTAPTTAPSTDNAGKVASFSNGVLTITLTDGTTVTGKVTDATELECPEPAETSTAPTGTTKPESGEHSTGHEGDGGEKSSGSDKQGDDEQGDHDDDDDGGSKSCTATTALVAGAPVHEAELSISSAGAVFRKIELA